MEEDDLGGVNPALHNLRERHEADVLSSPAVPRFGAGAAPPSTAGSSGSSGFPLSPQKLTTPNIAAMKQNALANATAVKQNVTLAATNIREDVEASMAGAIFGCC